MLNHFTSYKEHPCLYNSNGDFCPPLGSTDFPTLEMLMVILHLFFLLSFALNLRFDFVEIVHFQVEILKGKSMNEFSLFGNFEIT